MIFTGLTRMIFTFHHHASLDVGRSKQPPQCLTIAGVVLAPRRNERFGGGLFKGNCFEPGQRMTGGQSNVKSVTLQLFALRQAILTSPGDTRDEATGWQIAS